MISLNENIILWFPLAIGPPMTYGPLLEPKYRLHFQRLTIGKGMPFFVSWLGHKVFLWGGVSQC